MLWKESGRSFLSGVYGHYRCGLLGWETRYCGADDLSGPLASNLGIMHYENQNGQGKGEFVINVRYPVTWAFDSIREKLEEKLKGSHFSLESIHYTEPLCTWGRSFGQYFDGCIQACDRPKREASGNRRRHHYARSIPNTLAFGPCFPEDENLCHQRVNILQ